MAGSYDGVGTWNFSNLLLSFLLTATRCRCRQLVRPSLDAEPMGWFSVAGQILSRYCRLRKIPVFVFLSSGEGVPHHVPRGTAPGT